MTIEITITCKRCGAEFEPTHRDYVAGDWRTCPDCREPAEPIAPTPEPTEEEAVA